MEWPLSYGEIGGGRKEVQRFLDFLVLLSNNMVVLSASDLQSL